MASFIEAGVLDELAKPVLLQVLEAVPYAVSWVRLADGEIRYCNREFVRLFGHDGAHFRSVAQFVDRVYLHEHQRTVARCNWLSLRDLASSAPYAVPDLEIDVLGHDGAIHTVLHSVVILPNEQVAVAIFKDLAETLPGRRKLREIAFRDDLTGLMNRRGLREKWHIQTHSDPRGEIAFLMLDLDDFKPVNDCYGHAVGDTVLKVVAGRLTEAVRKTDMVCRLGGDEFGILLVAPGDAGTIQTVCDRILKSVAEPIVIGDVDIVIKASIGGCLYPRHAQNKRDLLQRADMALYRGKNIQGKGSCQWFTTG